MSILKFRYWDPFNGVMVYSEDAKNLRSFFAGYKQAVKGGNESIIMQCIGDLIYLLMDKSYDIELEVIGNIYDNPELLEVKES